jgi:glycosyltransferase involved in cell wall biosynthesis
MQNCPKISIVTVSYNQAAYLETTIKSVLNQNYPNLEYIIIDGGSTDGSVEIIKKYEKHLAYWISEKDNGMYDGLNKGFAKATGDIMAWINSDDIYHASCFSIVSEIFSTFPEVNWLLGVTTRWDEHGRASNLHCSNPWSKYKFYNKDFKWIQQESTFWRRSLWQKAGNSLNPSLQFAGDFDLWLRFFRTERLYITDGLLGGFRARQSQQKSKDNMADYLSEVNTQLENETISFKDKWRRYIILCYEYSVMLFLKNQGIIRFIYHKLHNFPELLVFDAHKLKYTKKSHSELLKINRPSTMSEF